MESHKICTDKRGFTLIELLIIMGIVSILAGSFLFIDLNSYRRDNFRAARSQLVTELRTARAAALNNIDQRQHSVTLSDQYQGYLITPDSLHEVIFEPLSGDVAMSGEIILTDPLQHATTTISINHEGRIQ